MSEIYKMPEWLLHLSVRFLEEEAASGNNYFPF